MVTKNCNHTAKEGYFEATMPLFVPSNKDSSNRYSTKTKRPENDDGQVVKRICREKKKKVSFAERLEDVTYYVVSADNLGENQNEDNDIDQSSAATSRRTEEITVLSSLHGRARRMLREITKFDLQSAVKHGVKSKAHPDRKTGLPRWQYVYGNVVYITDHTSTKEVTSYKQAIQIQPATITEEMELRHEQDVQALADDPQLCMTHSIIVIDQSGSMRSSDVGGFSTRSRAAYGVLALEYIAEQLHQRDSLKDGDGIVDAVSIIEMKDNSEFFVHREPMDWILFNKILHRQKEAKPMSHGNYNLALESVLSLIRTELENAGLEPGEKLDEIPDLSSYAIVFLSDGKPSDRTEYDSLNRKRLVKNLFEVVPASCVSFHAIGLGNSTQHEFGELEAMVNIVKARGGQGTFSFAQVSSCAMLSEAFSTASQSTTTTRTGMLAGADGQSANVKMKDVQLRKRYIPSSERRFNRFAIEVTRWKYDHGAYKSRSKLPWKQVGFKNSTAVGFDMEVDPFGKGAERLALPTCSTK